MKKRLVYLCGLFLMSVCSCTNTTTKVDFIDDNLQFAEKQISASVTGCSSEDKVTSPRTTLPDGSIKYAVPEDWTSGFFPGSLWLLYDYSGEEKWKNEADRFTRSIEEVKDLKWHHDVGFMINCSYGNAYRLTKNEYYKDVMIQAANSLITRYSPAVGCTKSWNVDRGWQAERGWSYPVIIDNMMNLELLFNATEFTGDSTYYDIAIAHANTTLENHFRDDYSCYHVIDYDSITGEVRHKHTAQGYAHESAWARGQAWAIYGYTMCYRFTKDPAYLKQAENIAAFLLNNKNWPADNVPYWDFNDPKIPNTYRDASAGSIIASALIELSTYANDGASYKAAAVKMLKSLGSPAYRAKLGENNNFVLMHSVGSIPHGAEIDVPLNYADYYFIEALLRLKALK
ncbi:glucuronyl hydrolase [Puteibacter caeruleilacunae]|nr:glucuronyl hydrolase [Puteibacter caeruleilacunae]